MSVMAKDAVLQGDMNPRFRCVGRRGAGGGGAAGHKGRRGRRVCGPQHASCIARPSQQLLS